MKKLSGIGTKHTTHRVVIQETLNDQADYEIGDILITAMTKKRLVPNDISGAMYC